MATRQPSLRRHVRGQYFVRWGGRDYWMGTDKAAAERLFLDPNSSHPGALRSWLEWRMRRETARPRGSAREHVVDLADAFLASYEADDRPATAGYYRRHLTRFVNVFGALYVDELEPAAIEAFRVDLSRTGLAPKTVSHDVGAVKTLLRWALRLGRCQPMNLEAIRKPRVPAPDPTFKTREQVAAMLAAARANGSRNLETHLALNYLCVARPSEVPRLIAGEGVFVPVADADDPARVHARGAFKLATHKTQHRTTHARILLLTDTALMWLDSSAPAFADLNAYSRAVRTACGPGGPKILQRSAASHLLQAGASEADVDLLLGHVPSGAFRHYVRAGLPALRRTAARIAL